MRPAELLLAFVRFGQHRKKRDILALNILDKFHVAGLRRMSRVKQGHNAEKAGVAVQICGDEAGPFVPFRLGTASVTVTGEIDQVKIFGADPVKIQAAGFSRRGTGLGQMLPPGQSVQQRRFSHIGASRQRKLRKRHVFQLIGDINGFFKNHSGKMMYFCTGVLDGRCIHQALIKSIFLLINN